MYAFTTTKGPNRGQKVAGNRFANMYIQEFPYENYSNAIDKLLDQTEKDEDERLVIREYLEEKTRPKLRKYRCRINDMLIVLDKFLGRSVDMDEIFKMPSDEIRDAINIYGISGSGKSYWSSEYCKRYKKLYPDRKIYLITTNKHDDDHYKKIGINKLDLSNRKIIDSCDFDEKTFANSLVIFDDIETHDRGIDLFVRHLRDMLFLKSRKHRTNILNVIHKSLDGYKTTIPNIECTGCVIFPRYNWSGAVRVLETYFAITPCQMKLIHSTKKLSRWVYIHKVFPKYMIHKDKIQMID